MIGGWGFCSGLGWLQTAVALKLSLVKSNSSSCVHARRTKSSHSVAYL